VPRLDALEDRTVPSFAAPTAIPFLPGGNLVKVADFNNDGHPDIVTANGTNLNVYMYYSPGVYPQTLHATLPAAITDVAVGNINADAYTDIAVATGQKTFSIFKGRGDGTFNQPAQVNLPRGPDDPTQLALNLAIGDLTGDGKADIVVGAESGTYRRLNSYLRDSLASVLIGKGDGTFRAGSTVVLDARDVLSNGAAVPDPVPVAIGDLNGDGKADVVAASYGVYGYIDTYPPPALQGDYHIHLLLGDGKGNLQENGAPWSIGFQDGGGGPPSLAVRDLNGDGRADIIAAYPDSSPSWGLHISVSDPTTGKFTTTVYAVSAAPVAVAVGDVTGDGKLDAVVATGGGGVMVLPGNGDGTFGTGLSFASGSSFTAMAMADLNGDGSLDLVLLDATSTYEMLNNRIW
jgi:hypothetical protein